MIKYSLSAAFLFLLFTVQARCLHLVTEYFKLLILLVRMLPLYGGIVIHFNSVRIAKLNHCCRLCEPACMKIKWKTSCGGRSNLTQLPQIEIALNFSIAFLQFYNY